MPRKRGRGGSRQSRAGASIGEIAIRADGAKQFQDLSKKLRTVARTDLRKKLNKAIQDAGKPAVRDVQSVVRGLPTTSSSAGSATKSGSAARRAYRVERARTDRAKARAEHAGAGLRESIAAATKVRIRARGVQIVVDSKQLPEDQRSLPRHMDSPKGWRHPVFGNREIWVHQKTPQWFGVTIRKHAPEFRRKVSEAVAEITRELES